MAAAILISAGGVMLVKDRLTAKSIPTTKNIITSPTSMPTAIPVKIITWSDEAGFTFQYPEGLLIDNHSSDNVDYANLTLTNGEASRINILMVDNSFQSIDDWAKAGSIDTNLGGKAGKKIIDGTGATTIGVIDGDVFLTIKKEANLSPLLETAWEKITESFEFVYPTPTAAREPVKVVNNQDGSNLLLEEN